MFENLRIKMNVKMVLRDKYGKTKTIRSVHNTVTTAGKNGICAQILGTPDLNKCTHMAVGTGTPAANALGAEVASSRTAFDSKLRTNNVITIITTFDSGVGTGTLIEAGLFDAASSGNMWASTTFDAVIKTADDAYVVTWTLTVE